MQDSDVVARISDFCSVANRFLELNKIPGRCQEARKILANSQCSGLLFYRNRQTSFVDDSF